MHKILGTFFKISISYFILLISIFYNIGRFFELSEVLERGTTPKLDKVGILTDAIRTVKLLREETSSLTCQNTELKQKITDLKVLSNFRLNGSVK